MMQTIRQAFTILRQNPLLSTISILGTAFAITMIMAIVITWQTKYADLEPEVNRSRCLYFSAMHMQGKENKDRNNYSTPSAAFMKDKCLHEKSDFVFETVFSSEEKLEFVKKAKEAGFFIRLFFVCTSDPAINVNRITQRYLDGGHEVPISKVISRYYKSLSNAGLAISMVDRAYVYDNSIENQMPQLLFRTISGKMFKQYSNTIPEWARMLVQE